MNHILNALSEIIKRLESDRIARRGQMQEFAPSFDPISLFSPNENTISKIISFFLDPNETHGQGDIFFRDFLAHCCKNFEDSLNKDQKVRVSNQFWTANGRPIDFVIQIGNNFIGFENKVWGAQDQQNQVNDYLVDLKNKAERNNGKYLLFYLSPHGDEPSDLSWGDSKGDPHLRVLSFSSLEEDGIIPLFERWSNLASAPHVKSFLDRIIFFLNKHFGERVMDSDIASVKPLIKDPLVFKEIPTIYQSYIAIKEDFLNDVCSFLKSEQFELLNVDIKGFLSGRKNLQFSKDANGVKTVFEIDPICIRIGIKSFPPSVSKEDIENFWGQQSCEKKDPNGFWEGGYSVISQNWKLDDYVVDYLKSTNEGIENIFFFRNEFLKTELEVYSRFHEALKNLRRKEDNF